MFVTHGQMDRQTDKKGGETRVQSARTRCKQLLVLKQTHIKSIDNKQQTLKGNKEM